MQGEFIIITDRQTDRLIGSTVIKLLISATFFIRTYIEKTQGYCASYDDSCDDSWKAWYPFLCKNICRIEQ